MKCVSYVLAVQRRCDAVVHFAPQELRGGAVDWVGTFRYGAWPLGRDADPDAVWSENIYMSERRYRFPHVSCSCFMCQQEAEHKPLRHTSRGPAPAAPNSYTRASTRSVLFHLLVCWHAVFNLSWGRTLGSRPQQTRDSIRLFLCIYF